MTNMLERVARAIWYRRFRAEHLSSDEVWECTVDDERTRLYEEAQAAIRAVFEGAPWIPSENGGVVFAPEGHGGWLCYAVSKDEVDAALNTPGADQPSPDGHVAAPSSATGGQ